MNPQQPVPDGSDTVFAMSEGVALTREYIRNRQHQSGLRFGTGEMDRYLVPMAQGDLVLVVGRPGNGKSLIIRHLLHVSVLDIMNRQQQGEQAAENECAVLVTWEESVEQAVAYWLAVTSGISATKMLMGDLTEMEWRDLDMAMVRVGAWPLYIVGHSIKRSQSGRRSRPQLAPSNVNVALEHILNERGIEPRVIGMDYLQRIHNEGRAERAEHLLRSIDWAKDTALWGGCPVLLGSQAGREVDKKGEVQLPGLADSQWSSNAEQSADKYLSVWMPKTTHPVGYRMKPFGGLPAMEVDERLMLVKVGKQKGAPSGRVFAFHVEPEYLRVEERATEEPALQKQPEAPKYDPLEMGF